jgi:hypothetical protein
MVEEDPKFIEEIDNLLDKYEQEMAGLGKWGRRDVPVYLDMPPEQVRKKTADELVEAVFLLNQYATNIQRLINRKRAWERCIKARLDELEARYIPDIPPQYGYNERPKLARHNPELCQRLNKFLRKVQMEADVLYGIPDHIHKVADSLRDMKFIALKREKAYASE